MNKASVSARLRGPWLLFIYCGLWLIVPSGCGSAGALRIESIAPEAGGVLHNEFDTAVYRTTGPQHMEAVLIAGPTETPAAALHIRMRYRSSPGSTPVSRNATSAVVNYIVFEGDAVRVYGGAGMLHLHDALGSPQVAGRLRNATLRLMDAGPPTTRQAGDASESTAEAEADGRGGGDEGGRQPAASVAVDEQTVTSAVANGTFTASRDDLTAITLIRSIRQRVRDRLTYPRLVQRAATQSR